MYLCIKSSPTQQKAATLLYAALFTINLYWPRIGAALDLTEKAYFFSAFPQKCPEGTPKPGYRLFLCYKYRFLDSRTALVFNPGDELAAPYTSWPPEFDKEIFGKFEPKVVVPSIEECRKKKTRQIARHIYVVEDHCWGATE